MSVSVAAGEPVGCRLQIVFFHFRFEYLRELSGRVLSCQHVLSADPSSSCPLRACADARQNHNYFTRSGLKRANIIIMPSNWAGARAAQPCPAAMPPPCANFWRRRRPASCATSPRTSVRCSATSRYRHHFPSKTGGRAPHGVSASPTASNARPPWHQTHPRIWRRDPQMCASLCQDAASQGNGRLPHFDALAAWHASQGVSPSMACAFG